MSTAVRREDPRITGNRAAVHRAALQLLAVDGVSGLTVDRLAEFSGVSRSTIYRRWSDMRTLAADAFDGIVHSRADATVDPEDNPSAALTEYLRDYARRLNDPTYATILVTLIEWAWRDPEFAKVQAETFDDSRSRARRILTAGRAQGVFACSESIDDAVEAVVTPFLYRRLILRKTIGAHQIRSVHRRIVGR